VPALGVALANLAGQLEAVHFRHQPVRQQDMRGSLRMLHQCVGGAAGEADILVAGLAQCATDHDAGEFGVIDDENAQERVGHGKLNLLKGDVLSLLAVGRALTRRIVIMTALS